ncbi:MAG: transposase [Nitrososphaeraceae archaeon]
MHLFKRHLSNKPQEDRYGRSLAHLRDKVELLAFCLMPNHFHLLIYNYEDKGFPELMQRVMTAYSMYFNKKYKRVGPLFQGTYKASLISDDAYLWHISRYIHLNPQDINQDIEMYEFSSLPYYLGHKQSEWLHPQKIMELHDSDAKKYLTFVKDYEGARKDLQSIKFQLANN